MRFLILRDVRYVADALEAGGVSTVERVHRAAIAAMYGGGVDGVILAGDVFADPAEPGAADWLAGVADDLTEILGQAVPIVSPDSRSAELPAGHTVERICQAAEPTDFSSVPFSYSVVTAGSGGLEAASCQLVHQRPGLIDTHVHTQFAYCGTDVTDEAAVDRARRFGLAGVCLTEHAGQLYVAREDFWSANFIHQPALWQSGSRERMDDYWALADPLRADDVLVGLETEVDVDGKLIVRDEDLDRADILLGAVHWLNADMDTMTPGEIETAFCRQTEQVLAGGVDVLVHPVRLFARKGLPVPKSIQQSVAKMLAEAGIPGEINFHKNNTPVEFYDICLAAGVKLALGSDSHRIAQVGNLDAHVRFLQDLTGRYDVSEFVWTPEMKGKN